MPITNQQRIDAEQTATPEQVALYEAGGQELYAIAEKYGLQEPKLYTSFALFVGDLILKLVDTSALRSELPALFPQLDLTTLAALEQDILTFLKPKSPAVGLSTPELAAEISQVEATLHRVHTMADDMQVAKHDDDPVHQSSQSDLLHRDN